MSTLDIRRYAKLFAPFRRRPTTVPGRSASEEALSDRGRIVFSAAFRRLQQKAQVFPLEENAAVRTRLTHSLEVAHIGRVIASLILQEFADRIGDDRVNEIRLPFVDFVESACLLHDIGNPPFGHFGEEAIKSWFNRRSTDIFHKSTDITTSESAAATFRTTLLPDFLQFDGNPQGFRVVTRLQSPFDEFGLNLTDPQLASFLKYLRSPHQEDTGGFARKPGYFHSEEELRDDMWKRMQLAANQRFPLVYVVEAADDIAFCISDMEDGIEKRIITAEECLQRIEECRQRLGSVREGDPITDRIAEARAKYKDPVAAFQDFKIAIKRDLADRAASVYVDEHSSILEGTADALIKTNREAKAAYKCLKEVARRYLYRSREAEMPELAGYHTVTGLLEHLAPLLLLTRDAFAEIDAVECSKTAGSETQSPKGRELEIRLHNQLPKKYLRAYRNHVKDLPTDPDGLAQEWYYRAHLVVDYVAGMTDDFALAQYQYLSGIRRR